MSFILTLQQRKKAFLQLGEYLSSGNEHLNQLIYSAHQYNAWFTPTETLKAIKAIASILNEPDLSQWLGNLPESNPHPKRVGLVLAGNIPMVGFHDILSVLATGHIALIKLSSQDTQLIPHLLNKLAEAEPQFQELIQFTERLENFDAVIATGSNNTSRYFEHYFGKVPHIIRKNRNSVAVLTGEESNADLFHLGQDIFDYFGLGCRNISKLFVPKGYNFRLFFEAIEPYNKIINHHKYNNNYDYNKSIFLVNREAHLDNGFVLLKEDERLASPLAVLYYEEYDHLETVKSKLRNVAENIQCLVCATNLDVNVQQVKFGESQHPKLWDYADGINTLAFLAGL